MNTEYSNATKKLFNFESCTHQWFNNLKNLKENQTDQTNDRAKRIPIEIEFFLKQKLSEDKEKFILEEKFLKYKFAAKVLDRFFFIISIIYVLLTFSSIILSTKNFYKSR